MSTCHTCELAARRERGEAPLWDSIYQTEHWQVAHAYNTSLPGWLVLVLRRHLTALAELTEAEALELGRLIRHVSLALHEAVGCAKTYVMQFAEQEEHRHVHVHVVPRMADQPPEVRGPRIFAYLGVAPEERLDEQAMDELARRLRQHLRLLEEGASPA